MDIMEERKQQIMNRLKKIEGQVKGIQRMVEEGKCCGDIMIQVSAVRSAINKIGGLMLEGYIKECMPEAFGKDKDDAKLEEMLDTIVKYVK